MRRDLTRPWCRPQPVRGAHGESDGVARSSAGKRRAQTCFTAADSLRNSLTTAASASGLTPFSQRLTRMDRVRLSSPQLRTRDISYKTESSKGRRD